jgi:hypothetical protein
MLSHYQASYPALLDMATYVSLTKLLGSDNSITCAQELTLVWVANEYVVSF